MPSKPTKYPALRVIVSPIETEDAERLWAEAIDAFAEALADRFIAKARAEVAAELGVDEARIDRERGRVVEDADEHRATSLGNMA
jgi:hypothetical protein